MSKINFGSFFLNVRKFMLKNEPELLIGVGIAGMVSTVILGVKATPKAMALIDHERKVVRKPIPKIEVVKLCWKCYVPTVLSGIITTACFITSASVSHRRNAALATAYSLSEAALKEYSERVVDIVGEKKQKEILDKIDEDHVRENPVKSNEVIMTKAGNTLCCDARTGRYFHSDIETLNRAANIISRRLMDEMSVSLNEFYYEIDLGGTQDGDEVGWNISDGLVSLRFSSQLTESGEPCIVMNFVNRPKYHYSNLY